MNFNLANEVFTNRLFLGTALYPNLEIMTDCIHQAQVDVITVALRKQLGNHQAENKFWQRLRQLKCRLLPNTAGCFNAKEAIYTAKIARDLFETNWIKLEVIGDELTLQPNPFELLKACEQLIKDDFLVFPYCTEDLILCQHLVAMGCNILMPWGSPIGSGKGILNPYGIKVLRSRFPECTLIIDAGIGNPMHAVEAMLLGCDGILLNSAVALAKDPVSMAIAFNYAVKSGRLAFEAGTMPERDFAQPSTTFLNKPMVFS